MRLPVGKLDASLLDRLLGGIPQPPEVLIGPGIGHDVTVLDLGHDDLLIAKTDPITFATDEIGFYAVAVNSNDVATSGGVPRWFLATVLLPEGQTDERLAETIFSQITEACRQLGVSLVGGHTEITHDLPRPIVVGQMLGQVPRERMVSPADLTPGDRILLCKGIPIEGVSLMARQCPDLLRQRGFDDAFIAHCAGFLHDPGIMVLPEARAICDAVRPHAMHDPTEGGLVTGLWEMAEAGSVGLRVEYEVIPILDEGRRLCDALGLDPLGVIGSGSLLVGVAAGDAEAAIAACEAIGSTCTAIAEAVPEDEGVKLVLDGRPEPMPRYDQDEIAKLF